MPDTATSRIQDYLADLDAALAHLPRDRRREIITDVGNHIDVELADSRDASPLTVERVLVRMGTPSEIAAAVDDDSTPKRPRFRTRDLWTVLLLLVGGVVVPIVGWLVGVALLWTSDTWRRRDQLIGTLLLPGGLLAAAVLMLFRIGGTGTRGCTGPAREAGRAIAHPATQCTSTTTGAFSAWLPIVLLVVSVTIPAWTSWWLSRQARHSR